MGRTKEFVFLPIIFLSVFTAGCSPKEKSDAVNVLKLNGNPSTGYSWSFEIQDESLVFVSEDKEIPKDSKDKKGAPCFFVYTFEGKKEGVTSIHFEYKRPWEDNPPIEEARYKVIVDEHKNVRLEKMPDVFISMEMDRGLKMKNEKSGSILLDVRRPEEFEKGHIPGAKQLTNESMEPGEVEKILPNKDQYIFVYCRSGRRSKEASKKLVSWGYKNVYEIGGILDYSGEVEK